MIRAAGTEKSEAAMRLMADKSLDSFLRARCFFFFIGLTSAIMDVLVVANSARP
jgi:hypothetical protein